MIGWDDTHTHMYIYLYINILIIYMEGRKTSN